MKRPQMGQIATDRVLFEQKWEGSDDLFSQRINILKLICTVGIVCMHTSYLSVPVGDGDMMVRSMDWLVFVRLLRVAMRVCVPTFFLLSGYLFVMHSAGDERFGSVEWYKGKFKRRVRSLMVPYLVSNIVVYLCFNIGNLLMQDLMKSGNSYCVYSSWTDYVLMFWTPANSVMWFLRDLIIVSFLTPIILPLLKWSRGVLLVLFGVLWYTDIWVTDYSGFSSVSFFFFYLGAWMGMNHGSNGLERIIGQPRARLCRFHSYSGERISRITRIGRNMVCLLAVCCWWYCAMISHTLRSDHTFIPLGMVLLFTMVNKLDERHLRAIDGKFWMPACVLIYAYHSMIQIPMKKGLYVLIRPENPLWNYAIYFSTVAFTVLFLAGVYWLMKRLMPRYTWLFTGR